MHCPFCLTEDTKVIDSRLVSDGSQVRRRRECISCQERFTTYEAAELVMPRIIKSDGRRVSFDSEKLEQGIRRALEKRPVSTEVFHNIIGRLMQKLRSRGEREVHSKLLGEWVMDELRSVDEVAYVRFASVYRSFQDVNAFREEIKRMEEQKVDV